MQDPEVKEISISTPIEAIGKIFTGDYAKSPQYITEVYDLLNQKGIPFIPNKIMGVYYDNPTERKPEDLKSFQGVFPIHENENHDDSFTKLSLKGKYLYIKVSGDPIKSIYAGYDALFNHIQHHHVNLESNTGYQVSTFENGIITTEIYLKII